MTVLWILVYHGVTVYFTRLVGLPQLPRFKLCLFGVLQAYVEPFVILTILILNAIIAIWQDSGFSSSPRSAVASIAVLQPVLKNRFTEDVSNCWIFEVVSNTKLFHGSEMQQFPPNQKQS